MPDSVLPVHLKGKLHNDWIFPFCYIPRGWTAFKLFQPPITLISYNCDETQEYNGKRGLHPIQRCLNGKLLSFHINFPLFFSIRFRWKKRGAYFICGFRWDAVDFYYNFPTIDISFIERFEK